MENGFLITEDLDIILSLIHSLGDTVNTLSKLSKTESISSFQGVIFVDIPLSSLGVFTLLKIEPINSSFFVFLTLPSPQCQYLIRSLFRWQEYQLRSRKLRAPIYLPFFVFHYLPKLDTRSHFIEDYDSLFCSPHNPSEVYSTKALRSNSIPTYAISPNFYHWIFSICSLKKYVQYLWLRTYRDLPND